MSDRCLTLTIILAYVLVVLGAAFLDCGASYVGGALMVMAAVLVYRLVRRIRGHGGP